ncbi:hypothetical protein ScalyP_jg544, partial [Parmales sp. scaly parma]
MICSFLCDNDEFLCQLADEAEGEDELARDVEEEDEDVHGQALTTTPGIDFEALRNYSPGSSASPPLGLNGTWDIYRIFRGATRSGEPRRYRGQTFVNDTFTPLTPAGERFDPIVYNELLQGNAVSIYKHMR